ncbi:hypothetical protein [Lentzea sp.]|uniref:hypothetical protein n=1 Tax=Lentzea sp. TaxID=56099 RepID=UPI002C1159B9|nr:hypothetical protein [Lentzea sp.]HUQ54491.1 hypothetical protein [Lentzea sp.]
MAGECGADGACGAAADGAVARLGGVASGRPAFGAPDDGLVADGLCGVPAEGAPPEGLCGVPPDGLCGMPPEGAPPEGIPPDGAEGAVGIEPGRAGASARAADVEVSGERGAGALAPRSPRLPGVPVQPWPPVDGRPAAGEDGALPPAFGAPPIGAAWDGVADGEPSGVRDGACGTSGLAGASGGATDDWTV